MVGQNSPCLLAGVSCRTGLRRMNNEDNFYLDGVYKGLSRANDPIALSRPAGEAALFGVCDGMGGTARGEYAAWSGVSLLARNHGQITDSPAPYSPVMDYIRAASQQICGESTARGSDMGCTLALAVFHSGHFSVYNLGDSRIYWYTGGILRQLSQDHTAAQELIDLGVATPEALAGSRKHDQLTQYLGIPAEELIVEPGQASGALLHPTDRLLLCSDGLSGMVSDGEMARLLGQNDPPGLQAIRLTEAAETAGGRDNITALIIALAE